MKITITQVGGGSISLEDFADKHQLEMEVRERPLHYRLPRYYASFKHIEIKRGSVLESTFGDGNTIEEAITDYANQIAGRFLIYKAYNREERKEFWAPNEFLRKGFQ